MRVGASGRPLPNSSRRGVSQGADLQVCSCKTVGASSTRAGRAKEASEGHPEPPFLCSRGASRPVARARTPPGALVGVARGRGSERRGAVADAHARPGERGPSRRGAGPRTAAWGVRCVVAAPFRRRCASPLCRPGAARVLAPYAEMAPARAPAPPPRSRRCLQQVSGPAGDRLHGRRGDRGACSAVCWAVGADTLREGHSAPPPSEGHRR